MKVGLSSRFALRLPGTPDLETALARGIARAGTGGVRYTRRQLYYAVCRALLPPERVIRASAWMLGAAGAGLLALRGAPPPWTGLGGSAVGLSAPRLVRVAPFTLKPPLSESAFEQALADYRARHGDPPGLLPDAPPSPRALAGREADLHDYGMALALVCQDAALARMLRANLLHMELGCAILSLEEASPLPDALVAMLMRAPAPRVLLLHDASPEGLRLVAEAERLLDPPRGLRIRAPGLRPRHALRMHLFAARQPGVPAEAPVSLRALERAWLRAGYRAELAALHPPALLRALRRIAQPARRREPWLARLRRWPTTGYMSWPG